MAKNSLPMRPICQRNHPSFETIPAAKAVLTPVVAAWFDSRVLKYIRRHHRLPQSVLASGSVSKASPPWHRLVSDLCLANVFAVARRVKCITVADITG